MVKIKKNKKTKFQKDQVLCSKWNSYTLLAGMQTGMAIWESSLAVSFKHAFIQHMTQLFHSQKK